MAPASHVPHILFSDCALSSLCSSRQEGVSKQGAGKDAVTGVAVEAEAEVEASSP